MVSRVLVTTLWLVALASTAGAATITIQPGDSYTKIEAAGAGDLVLIEPGTYTFRVMLSKQASAAQPITIRAKDPTNRPVWDLGGQPVGSWPGSYTAGDKGRGCWQVSGGHYVIEGIVFRNCQDDASAGLRAIDSGPITVRDCLFEDNTNGLTGSSDGLVVEFSEFRKNGKLTASGSPTHNVYIYGGVFTLRYSYLHDPLEGQNIHIRARQALIEYNWLSRPASYPADLMSCNTLCGGSGTGPITQKMTLRGNVIVQASSGNLSQIVALFNDEPSGSYDGTGAVSAMELTMIHNTVVGVTVPGTQRLVNMRNDTVATSVALHNNILYQVKELAIPASPSLTNWSVSGQSNWVSTGTSTTGLTGSISGAGPGFVSAADYRLTAQSPCLGQAASVSGLPDKEYYLNETITSRYRPRPTASDLGAYEQGNASAPVGPYGSVAPTPDAGPPQADAGPPDAALPTADAALPTPDAGPALDGPPLVDGPAIDAGLTDGARIDATAQDAGPPGEPGGTLSSDCGCRVGQQPTRGSPLWLLLIAAGRLLRRRR